MANNIRPAHIRSAMLDHDVRKLLTETNPKVLKNDKVLDIPTAVLHLLPKYRGTCPFAASCAKLCLHSAGNPAYMRGKETARKNRTDMFMTDREAFMELLLIELVQFASKHHLSLQVGTRLNGTSDIRWERESINVTPDTSEYLSARYGLCILPGRYRNIMYCLSTNKDISFQFYDYTKRPDRLWDVCKADNYHLTMSQGSSADTFRIALDHGLNLAAAFNIKKNAPLPETVTLNNMKFRVIDGDVTDYRPNDEKHGYGTNIVGLRLKRVPGMTENQIKEFCIS
jgi:hypothetical protein